MVEKVDHPQKSLYQYYQEGLLTKRELRRLAPTLQGFLKTQDLGIQPEYYMNIYESFKGDGSIFQVRNNTKRGFLVDPVLISSHVKDITDIFEEAKESTFPLRTEEERLHYQNQILRRPNREHGLANISLDEAKQELHELAFLSFMNADEIDEKLTPRYAEVAVKKSMPYLLGKRGVFANINHFKSDFFHLMIFYLKKDVHRSRIAEENLLAALQHPRRLSRIEPTTESLKRKAIPAWNQAFFDRLDPLKQKIVDLWEGHVPYSRISQILEDDGYEEIRPNTMKVWIHRIRKRAKTG